jgi:hypothetical protein
MADIYRGSVEFVRCSHNQGPGHAVHAEPWLSRSEAQRFRAGQSPRTLIGCADRRRR